MRSLYFRTDGNSEIATGHLMRCLSIARACRATDKFSEITFLVSDEDSAALLEGRFQAGTGREFPIICLHSDYRHPEQELSSLLPFLSERSCSQQAQKPVVFIDSYFVTPEYFKALTPYCRVAYLDDLRSFSCPVDLVINYDTSEDCEFYQEACQKLLGAEYTPLRAQFQNPSYHVRSEVTDILLSAGGTDPYGVCIALAERLKDTPLSHCRLHILTSSANPRYQELITLSDKDKCILLHENVSDMAGLMSTCDLAVSAGGTTLSELCAVGVPTVSFLMADNQFTAVRVYAKTGLIPYAGDIRPNTENLLPDVGVLDNILLFLTSMSQDWERRKKSSQSMRAFSDGCGAGKIAEKLFLLS